MTHAECCPRLTTSKATIYSRTSTTKAVSHTVWSTPQAPSDDACWINVLMYNVTSRSSPPYETIYLQETCSGMFQPSSHRFADAWIYDHAVSGPKKHQNVTIRIASLLWSTCWTHVTASRIPHQVLCLGHKYGRFVDGPEVRTEWTVNTLWDWNQLGEGILMNDHFRLLIVIIQQGIWKADSDREW